MSIPVGTLCIAVGVAVIVFRDPYMKYAIRFQNSVFGFSFEDQELRWSKFGAVAVGAGFVGVGIALLAGAISA
jgi:hypothetical protein